MPNFIHYAQERSHLPVQQFADRFRHDPAWDFHTMDASHSPNITAQALASLLFSLA